MSIVRFDSDSLASECRNFGELSDGFFEPHERSWDDLARDIKRIGRTNSPHTRTWELGKWSPFVTRPSMGYDRNPGRSVRGCISFKWEVVRRQHKHVDIDGIASFSALVCDANDGEIIVSWNFDIADVASPGSCFHVQMTHGEPGAALPVPRLHSLVTTPPDAADFLLGELFQQEWKAHVSRAGDTQSAHLERQQRRLKRLLEWKHQEVQGATGGSVWSTLKQAYPSSHVVF
ncbi:MAG: hypothetical protein AAGI88_23180 [Pseudomonadota bacterium]